MMSKLLEPEKRKNNRRTNGCYSHRMAETLCGSGAVRLAPGPERGPLPAGAV
jgi:hypothetical protein